MGDSGHDGDDYGLAAALAAYPDALITGITPEGKFCPVPPELGSTHEVIEADSVFDIVPQSEWGRVGTGWLRIFEYGSYVGSTLTNWGDRRSMLTYDARARFGMIIMLVVTDESLGDASTDDHLPLATRFGVYHRDVLANVVGMDVGAEGLLDWTVQDFDGLSAADLIHPDDAANSLENWLITLSAPGQATRWRGRHRHKDESYRWIEFTNTNRIDDLGYVVSEMMDISEEMAAAEALRDERELLARLNDALPVGVVKIDRDWQIVYANNRLFEIVGRAASENLRDALSDVAAGDLPRLKASVEAVLTNGTDKSLELRLTLANGTSLYCEVTLRALRDGDGVINGAVICVADITEATYLRRELEDRATFDQLTGCHNRAATMAEMRRALLPLSSGQPQEGTAAIFIDLDRFKPVNDELGHAAGDELLVAVAARIRELIRGQDVVGRIGGDEFLIVCPGVESSHVAVVVGERVEAKLAEPFLLNGTTVTIGASLGVAWTDSPDATPDSLVAAADAAMYRSKREGRAKVTLADSLA